MKNLDLTLDYMENSRFNYIYGPLAARLESQFTETEVLCLAMVYHKFVLENGPRAKFMTLMQLSRLLMQLFKVSDPDIIRRIMACVSYDPNCTDPAFSPIRHCTLASFVRMISIYFSTDLEKRMQFVFNVYDSEGLGYLNREQVMRYVDKFFNGDDEDEVFECRLDMLETLFVKFDLDKDLLISYEEYSDAVRKQPALLEFLGNVFPSKTQLTTVALCFNLLSWKLLPNF